MAVDSKMSCLCCDRMILVDSVRWGSMEVPIALCPTCAETVPMATVKVLFVMRSQIKTLVNDVLLLKRDISRLYRAQQDMEQALVGEA